MNSSFPADWPQECPPTDAEVAGGQVYRVVKSNPPTEEDLLSVRELRQQRNGCPCMQRGLSVFHKYRDACHTLKVFPKLGKFIAKGDLEESHGKQKKTGKKADSHYTWWPYREVDRASLFKVLPREGRS